MPDSRETERLGQYLARLLPGGAAQAAGQATAPVPGGQPVPLLLDGPLGAGKTSLTRALVAASQGGDLAEFSSPSFNIYNLYPTIPVIAHADLYRLPPGSGPDDDLLEMMEDGKTLLIMEWAGRLPEKLIPSGYLHLELMEESDGRRVNFTAKGARACELLDGLRQMFSKVQG